MLLKIFLSMNCSKKLWIVFIALFCFAGPASGALRINPSAEVEEPASLSVSEKQMRKARARIERNRAKYEKRLNRMKRKMKKRGLTGKGQGKDTWNDDKFHLGLVLLMLAIGLGIIGGIISLVELFLFISVLFAVAAAVLVLWSIVFLLWGLVEHFG